MLDCWRVWAKVAVCELLGSPAWKHVQIQALAHSRSTFRDYKGRFPVSMMALVDANCRWEESLGEVKWWWKGGRQTVEKHGGRDGELCLYVSLSSPMRSLSSDCVLLFHVTVVVVDSCISAWAVSAGLRMEVSSHTGLWSGDFYMFLLQSHCQIKFHLALTWWSSTPTGNWIRSKGSSTSGCQGHAEL